MPYSTRKVYLYIAYTWLLSWLLRLPTCEGLCIGLCSCLGRYALCIDNERILVFNLTATARVARWPWRLSQAVPLFHSWCATSQLSYVTLVYNKAGLHGVTSAVCLRNRLWLLNCYNQLGNGFSVGVYRVFLFCRSISFRDFRSAKNKQVFDVCRWNKCFSSSIECPVIYVLICGLTPSQNSIHETWQNKHLIIRSLVLMLYLQL